MFKFQAPIFKGVWLVNAALLVFFFLKGRLRVEVEHSPPLKKRYPPGKFNISHQWESKLIFPTAFGWDMLVPRRVNSFAVRISHHLAPAAAPSECNDSWLLRRGFPKSFQRVAGVPPQGHPLRGFFKRSWWLRTKISIFCLGGTFLICGLRSLASWSVFFFWGGDNATYF